MAELVVGFMERRRNGLMPIHEIVAYGTGAEPACFC